MPSLSTLQAWREEAYIARQQLAVGALMVSCTRDGRSVTFAAAEATKLDNWITELDRLIDAATAGAPTTRKRIFRIKQTGQGYH